jgi:hypothetical protein
MENVIKLHDWWTKRKRHEAEGMPRLDEKRQTRHENSEEDDEDDNDEKQPLAASAYRDSALRGIRELSI